VGRNKVKIYLDAVIETRETVDAIETGENAMEHEIDMTSEQIHAEADAAERVLVSLAESFHHHDSRPVPEGLRLIWRAQYHVNNQRQMLISMNRYINGILDSFEVAK